MNAVPAAYNRTRTMSSRTAESRSEAGDDRAAPLVAERRARDVRVVGLPRVSDVKAREHRNAAHRDTLAIQAIVQILAAQNEVLADEPFGAAADHEAEFGLS